jgi:hypothetical protein
MLALSTFPWQARGWSHMSRIARRLCAPAADLVAGRHVVDDDDAALGSLHLADLEERGGWSRADEHGEANRRG